MRIETLTRQQCIDVVSMQRLARLACAKNGQPYVVPIYYAFEGHYLYSFSLTGQKIDWMRNNPMVCVEVNEPGGKREWRSVIIKGVFEELPHLPRFERERGHAWSLISRHPNWWEPGDLKPVSRGCRDRAPSRFLPHSDQDNDREAGRRRHDLTPAAATHDICLGLMMGSHD